MLLLIFVGPTPEVGVAVASCGWDEVSQCLALQLAPERWHVGVSEKAVKQKQARGKGR